MSEYRSRRSPYELGELKGSPERHTKKKKSSKKSKKKSHQLPPEAKPYVHKADEDDDVQIIEAAGHGEEEGGSLTIKPPQTQISKQERSHKHKKEKHRSRELVPNVGRERFYNEGKKERLKEQFDAPRDFRDAREIVRERKKERELKEMEVAREITRREARKREESIKERERLERMELERRRERQMREDHTQEKETRQQKRKEDRRYLLDKRERGSRGEEIQQGDHYRSRSRNEDKFKDQSRSFLPPAKNQQEEKVSKKEMSRGAGNNTERYGKVGNEKSEIDQDTRRVVVDDSVTDDRDRRKSKKKEYNDDLIMVDDTVVQRSKLQEGKISAESKQEKHHKDDDDDGGEAGEESEEESDSDSEDSDSDSSSEEDSSEEEEGEDVEEDEKDSIGSGKEDEIVDRTDDGRGKVRSKFDDHSEGETPEHGSDHSRSDDNYIPDSPEMSDVEEDNLPLYLPAIQGCRSVEEFNCLNRIEEGTYGVVYRALDKKTNEIVALKRLKMEKEKEGFPITSLREINTLLKAQHENIVTVREIVVGSNMDKIYIVMDFVEHDLKSLMENMKNPFLVGEVKTLLKQLLRAVRHLHDNWILHRDLKTSNLLLSHKGILKVGDFGLAREYGSPLRNYTPVVVTLWYRAPELLLGSKKYSTLVDMWSVGCIFAELLLMKALWPGKSEIDQINKIFKDLGTPTEKIWPAVMELPGMKKVNFNDNPYNVLRNRFGSYLTDNGFSLLNRFFAFDPEKRIIADEALVHEYFTESPLPVDPSMFPTWPARSEQTKKLASSPKPPSGGKAYQKLMDEEENLATSGGFHMSSAAKGVSAQGMGFSLKF